MTAPVRLLKDETPTVAALTALVTKAVVASFCVASPITGVGPVGVPVKFGEPIGAPPTERTSDRESVTGPCLPFQLVTVPAAIALDTNIVLAI